MKGGNLSRYLPALGTERLLNESLISSLKVDFPFSKFGSEG